MSKAILAVECLNNSCTTLTSSPLASSNVENVWRKVCYDSFLPIPSLLAAGWM
jgi:hypothetical protein